MASAQDCPHRAQFTPAQEEVGEGARDCRGAGVEHLAGVFGGGTFKSLPFTLQPPGAAPDGRVMDKPWRRFEYDFALARAAG